MLQPTPASDIDFDPQDITMQIQVDSDTWHRRAIGQLYTACGLEIDDSFPLGIRHETYQGRLCRNGCFSQFELTLSAKKNGDSR